MLGVVERAEVVSGLVAELRRFRDLVADLDSRDLATPTRCAGWTVFDLAAHVTGVMADIAAGRLDGVNTQAWYDRQVAERRGRTREAILDELDDVIPATAALFAGVDDAAWHGPAVPGVDGTLGSAVHSLWCGTYIHAEDIAAALGRPPREGPGLRGALTYLIDVLRERGWDPATVDLAELDDSNALSFVLAVSGRGDPTAFELDAGVNVYA